MSDALHVVCPHCNTTNRVKQGDLGVKTGKGFYDWNTKSIDDLKQLRDDFIIQTLHFRAKHKSV